MRMRALVVACLLTLVLPAVSAADHHEGSLMAELEALGDALTKAMLENDVETMFSMYLDDAISLPNFEPRIQGIEAMREHHAQMTPAGMKIESFESHPTEAWEAGDHVIEIGQYKIALEVPGMGRVEDEGSYMTIYVRDADGDLKIKAETWNTDHNPMEMMGGPPPGDEGGEE